MVPSFEFDTIRRALYSADELLEGFDASKPSTFASSKDFRIYREFMQNGAADTTDTFTALMRGMHDTSLTQHLAQALSNAKATAIMGGHSLARDQAAYRDAARIACKLAGSGLTILSGGGPGAMEAAHLGAMFEGDVPSADRAIDELIASKQVALPRKADQVIKDDGSVDEAIAGALGAWLAPAVSLRRQVGKPSGGGLSMPTFHYGHEPFTPFAARIAKYFQNSIREDGLLAVATHGIIFVEGGPGTMQEVFQDAAQNAYHSYPAGRGAGYFSPMVFFGDVWIKMGLEAILKPLIAAKHADEYAKWVLFTSDIDAAVAHITSFEPPHANMTLEALADG